MARHSFSLATIALVAVASLLTPVGVGAQVSTKSADDFETIDRWPARAGAHDGAAPTVAAVATRPAAVTRAAARFAPTDSASLVNDPTVDTTPATRDTQSETTIVRASGTKLVAAYNDSQSLRAGSAFTGYSTSADNGVTWVDRGTPGAPPAGDAGDPVLAYSKKNARVYLATLHFSGAAPGINVYSSADDGVTFGAPVNALPGVAAGTFIDKPWIAVDNVPGVGYGNVYLFARLFGGTDDMRFTRSTDGGATWGPGGGTFIAFGPSQGAQVAVGPDHTVYVMGWTAFGGGAQTLRMRSSTDQGVTFGPTSLVATLTTTGVNGDLGLQGGLRTNAFPQLAANPVNGNLYVVYDDLGGGSDRGDVFLTMSTDKGVTWSAPVRVNNDTTSRDQWMPSVAVNKAGDRLMVSWYDRRADPNNDLIQRWGAIARLTPTPAFIRNFPVSPAFPVVINQDGAVVPGYMGDYDTIAGGTSDFQLTWGDNRDSDAVSTYQPDVRRAAVPTKPIAADLQVTQSPSTTSPAVGTPMTITVTPKRNGGAGTVTNGTVIINLFGPVVATSAVPSKGTCTTYPRLVTCWMGSYAAGEATTVDITVVPAAAGSMTSSARVFHPGPDTAPANDVSTLTLSISGTTVTKTYTREADCAIPDLGAVSCPISVPDGTTVVGVKVRLRIAHTADSDLITRLQPPTGAAIPLVNRRGDFNNDFGTGPNPCGMTSTFAVLDDVASIPIASGTAPFTGTFRPEGYLRTAVGAAAAGTWSLKISDNAAGDTGTVLCWKLTLTLAS